MRPTLSPSLLSRLSELVAGQTGLNFPEERWGDLERGIAAAAPDFNFPDRESCANWLLSAPLTRHMKEILATHLSVGETYFFREKQNLGILEEQILPQLLQARRQNEQRRLRIWSAGCCTGEEAYTIAILLDRLIPDLKEWNVTILATDFNPKFLRKAAQGVYGEWSFRDAPGWLRERYFTTGADGRLEILPRIRKMVTFSYLNFAEDVYPSLSNNTGAMDVIFCRNVLMYFTAQRAKQVADNFHRALVDGGWMIVSLTEASNRLLSSFTPVEFPGGVLYRKMAGTGSQPFVMPIPDRNAQNLHLPLQGAGWDGLITLPHAFTPIATEPTPILTFPLKGKGRSPLPLQGGGWEGDGLTPLPLKGRESLPDLTENEISGHSVPPDPALSAANFPDVLADQVPVLHAGECARNCANQGRLDEAVEWCEKAIAADKMNPSHHYLLATILQEQGQHDIAIRSLMRALYLDPDFVLAHFALGNLHQSQERYREAQRYFGNVLLLLRNHPPDETLLEADGLTAGRLAEIVSSLQASFPQLVASNV